MKFWSSQVFSVTVVSDLHSFNTKQILFVICIWAFFYVLINIRCRITTIVLEMFKLAASACDSITDTKSKCNEQINILCFLYNLLQLLINLSLLSDYLVIKKWYSAQSKKRGLVAYCWKRMLPILSLNKNMDNILKIQSMTVKL